MSPKVTSDLKFSFDNQRLAYDVGEFWDWAFSNITTPVIRGVMIEFILARHLIDHVDDIVLGRVLDLTHQVPLPGQLAKSLAPFYSNQPHGDVFDLQLTWGVTIEIKSTSNRENWRLNKTCRWNMAKDKNKVEKVFPAQYYILAVVEKDPEVSVTHLNLSEAEFYLCSGRTLDINVEGPQKSVGFNKFSEISVRCGFSELVPVLHELQRQEHERVRNLLVPRWKQSRPPSFHSNFMPLAVEANGKVTGAWYQGGSGALSNPTAIDVRWVDGANPDWRDWEAVGFKYEPEI
ncbi:hypothetical protein [Pseudomonas fluorescens]|uniref:hypothetical protein n=1 Tax=Pseudomonas fluorescens TaxID=294 RepID=UPI00069900F0|nr:hypothetical protein [Pseudomonas fluorescens]